MSAPSPLVSVIIPSKNRPGLVQKTIDSVMGQTYRNVEIIVVDDGSNVPLPPMLAERFGDIVVCFRHESSCGAPAARNFGATHAKGEFVAFLDDDDIWHPEKLEKQMAAFSSLGEEYGVVYCGYDFWIDGSVIERKNIYHEADRLHEVALAGCPVGSPTPVIKKIFFEAVGGFDDSLPACQDWDLWIRLSSVCQFFPVRQSLAHYRVHGDQISVDILNKINARKMILEKYREDISANRRILSMHYQRIGSLCSFADKKKEAKSYFWRSIQISKTNLGSWVHLILQYGGRRVERFLIEKYGITKVGKVRIIN